MIYDVALNMPRFLEQWGRILERKGRKSVGVDLIQPEIVRWLRSAECLISVCVHFGTKLGSSILLEHIPKHLLRF